MIEILALLLVGATVLSLINALMVLDSCNGKIVHPIVAILLLFVTTVMCSFTIGSV